MGCDIHLVIERKLDGKWVGVYCSDHAPERNKECCKLADRAYRVFGELAKVRCQPETGHDPRGLPDDISETGKAAYDYYGDGHTESWLSAKDFVEAYHRGYSGYIASEPWYRPDNLAYDILGLWEDEVEDCRVIFWFDN